MTSKMLLTTREASEQLGICQRTIWQLAKDGDLPSVRIGKLLRFCPEQLREWIEEKSKGGARC